MNLIERLALANELITKARLEWLANPDNQPDSADVDVVTPYDGFFYHKVETRDYIAPDAMLLTPEHLEMPEFHAMVKARERVKRIHNAVPHLIEAEAEYNAAWDALAALVR